MKRFRNSNYLVTREGRIWSEKRKIFLKPNIDKYGYMYYGLMIGGKLKSFKEHRIVAEVYIPNPENLETVNHINKIKIDNRVENLEWMTVRDNVTHGIGRKVGKYSKDGELLKIYDCIVDVLQDGFCRENVTNCCKEKKYHKTHKGYIWKYEN